MQQFEMNLGKGLEDGKIARLEYWKITEFVNLSSPKNLCSIILCAFALRGKKSWGLVYRFLNLANKTPLRKIANVPITITIFM